MLRILKKYPDKRSAILAALYIVQRRQNYLTENDIRDVARALELNITEVQAIVGFYTLFRKEPTGKYMIQVCTDLPCALRGAEEFYHRLLEEGTNFCNGPANYNKRRSGSRRYNSRQGGFKMAI